MADITNYGITFEGHDVQLEYDEKLRVVNRLRLSVDGRQVDQERIVYGGKELTATLDDGSEIIVHVETGMIGEARRVQLKLPGGDWRDLEKLG